MNVKTKIEILARALVLVLFVFGLAVVFPIKGGGPAQFGVVMGLLQSILPVVAACAILLAPLPEWDHLPRLTRRALRRLRMASLSRWIAAALVVLAFAFADAAAVGVSKGDGWGDPVLGMAIATAFAYFAILKSWSERTRAPAIADRSARHS